MPRELPEQLDELETLTRDYARYSRSAGGLASVLGGLCCLLSYLLGGLLPMTPTLRGALVALPLVWLLARQVMVRRYYQRLGHVEEQEGVAERRTHRAILGVVMAVAALLTVSALAHGAARAPGTLGWLALVWLLALAGWRWLRSPLDFFVGAFLFCQAGLLCLGRAYPVLGTAAAQHALPMALLALLFPLAALLLIVRGVADHRHFLRLRERLLRGRGAAGGA